MISYPKEKLKWIPWARYVLLFTNHDVKKTISLGRFRRREGLGEIVNRLSQYKGYELEIIDTKEIEEKKVRSQRDQKK